MAVACTKLQFQRQTGQMGIASTAQTSAENEKSNLEEARNQAVQHGDVAELDRMTSDDYTFHYPKRRDAHQIRYSQELCIRIIRLRIAANLPLVGKCSYKDSRNWAFGGRTGRFTVATTVYPSVCEAKRAAG